MNQHQRTRGRGRRRAVALLSAVGIVAGAGVTQAPAASAEEPRGSLEIALTGPYEGAERAVTGACFQIYGYEGDNPSMDVGSFCDVDDGVLRLNDLPLPSSGMYLVQETDAPDLVLTNPPWGETFQFGRALPFDMAANSSRHLYHEPAGSVRVTRRGMASEDDHTVVDLPTGCYSIEREVVPNQEYASHGIYCGENGPNDLEPDAYVFRAYGTEGYLSSTTRVTIHQGENHVELHTALAPDLTVTQHDVDGAPMGGSCFELFTVSVPDYRPGYQMASTCDSFDGDDDGRTTFVDIEPGTYTLVQTDVAEGYRLAADREVGVAPIPTICAPGTCPEPPVVEGELLPVVTVEAVDADGDAAPGACFGVGTWVDWGEGGPWFDDLDRACDWHDGATDGTTSLRPDGVGEYLLIEEIAPEGMRDAEPVPVTLTGEDMTITVAHTAFGNQPPAPEDDEATTDEDVAVTGDVLANDLDDDGDPLVASLGEGPAHGVASVEEDGSFTYTPAADFHGTDSFTYEVSDDTDTSSATVTVTVVPVNDAPVATDDVASTDAGTSVTIDVLGNDTDVDGDVLSVDVVTAPAGGSATVAADGTVAYTPAAGFSGADTFTYTVSDGAATATGAVAVTVAPPAGGGEDPTDPVDAVEAAERSLREAIDQVSPRARRALDRSVDTIIALHDRGAHRAACTLDALGRVHVRVLQLTRQLTRPQAATLDAAFVELGRAMGCRGF